MSFGFSPSDIVALVNITTKAYRGWKNACGEYSEVTGSLDSLLIVLERIENEASKPNSVLLRTANDRQDLKDILSNSEPTVRELHAIVIRYKSLGASREKNWDRLRLGVKNLDPLRVKLTQHITAITAYLDAVGLGALGRIERDLNAIPARIQHTIDALAAEIRAGRREGSIMTTYSDDEKDVWKQFRRELIGDGMKSSFVHKYKPLIRKYLKELAERGELEELPLEDETLAQKSLLNSDLSREGFLERTKLSAFELKAMPKKQVQQSDFARGYIAHARAAENSMAIRPTGRKEQSPHRSSQSSAADTEMGFEQLAATDALASILHTHREHEPGPSSHAQPDTRSVNHDRKPPFTVYFNSESDTDELAESHEGDRTMLDESSTVRAVEPSIPVLTKGNQGIEPVSNVHSLNDGMVSNTAANVFHIKAESEMASNIAGEHITGLGSFGHVVHAPVKGADNSDAAAGNQPTKLRQTDGGEYGESVSSELDETSPIDLITGEAKSIKKDRPKVVRAIGASSWAFWNAELTSRHGPKSIKEDDLDFHSQRPSSLRFVDAELKQKELEPPMSIPVQDMDGRTITLQRLHDSEVDLIRSRDLKDDAAITAADGSSALLRQQITASDHHDHTNQAMVEDATPRGVVADKGPIKLWEANRGGSGLGKKSIVDNGSFSEDRWTWGFTKKASVGEEEALKPRGILNKPTKSFPLYPNARREGVAPLRDVGTSQIYHLRTFTNSFT
jgi:hypothetical protein